MKPQDPDHRGTIGFVSLEIYPSTGGGVGILLYQTIRLLLKEGYRVVLVLDVQPHEFDDFKTQQRPLFENGTNLHIYSVAELSEGYVFPTQSIPHSEITRSARIAVAVEAACQEHRIDLFEFYDYCGPAYYFMGHALPKAPRIAVRLHNTVELIARKIRSAFDPERIVQFSAERAALQGADLILSPGQNFYDQEIVPLYPEAAPDRVQISPPVHEAIGEISYSVQAKNVVFYGRLSTFKGLDTFVRAAVIALQTPAFSDWLGTFIIMGPEETVASAYTLQEIKDFIPPELMARFEFTGRVSHTVLMDRLAQAAFACFANRMESFCYAAHELHTAGIPLILSDTPAFRDHFVADRQALFFNRSAPDLAARMVALAEDAPLRETLSRTGQERAASYQVDYYAEHLRFLKKHPAQKPAVITPTILVLAGDDPMALATTLSSVQKAAKDVYVLQQDPAGRFRFSGTTWSLHSTAGTALSPNDLMASDAVLILRAGDILQPDWFERALTVMGRQGSVGAVAGWARRDQWVLMQETALLPEAVVNRLPGLRTLIRTNPHELLQDVLHASPGDSESTMLLSHRAAGRLLLTVPLVACDITNAILLDAPSQGGALRHNFDLYSPDYLTGLVLEGPSDELPDTYLDQSTLAALVRSQREPGFCRIRVVPDSEADREGGSEVQLLRLFTDPRGLPVDWSALLLDATWARRHEQNSPVYGSIHSDSGQAEGFLPDGSALDIVCGAWAGMVEFIYAGHQVRVNLYSKDSYVMRVCLDAEHGATPDYRGQKAGMVPLGLAGWEQGQMPANFIQTGQCSTIILTAAAHDLQHWPAARLLAGATLVASPGLMHRPTRLTASRLETLIGRAGTRRLVFSSQLLPDEDVKILLQHLPEDVALGLAICGAPGDGALPGSLLCHASAWFSCLAPYVDRLTVLGGANGLRAFFADAGAATVPVSLWRSLAVVVRGNEETGDTPDTVVPDIALVLGDEQPINLMHMINGLILAQMQGLEFGRVFVPGSYRGDLHVLDDLRIPIDLSFYADVGELALLDTSMRRIAMGCFAQEGAPTRLAKLAGFGWLPVVGASSAFDTAPESLRTGLCVPYWENAAMIAERLTQICADYPALSAEFTTFAHQEKMASRQAIEAFLKADSDTGAGTEKETTA